MKVDAKNSIYQEASTINDDFDREELRHLRFLLRRLRYLDEQVERTGGVMGGSGGATFAEYERDALAYTLTEIGFLKDREGSE